MHVYIHDTQHSNEEAFQRLAASFGNAPIGQNCFSLPHEFGSGTMRYAPVSAGLSLGVYEYTRRERSFIGIRRSDREHYYLTFSSNKMALKTAQRMQMGNIALTIEEAEYHNAFLMSSRFDLMSIQPPGFQVSQLLLSFDRAWLNEQIGHEQAETFFDRYMLLRAKTFSVITLNDEMQHRIRKIKAALSMNEPIEVIELQSRELAGIYFSELLQVLQGLASSTFNESDTLALLRYVFAKGDDFFLRPLSRTGLANALNMGATKLAALFQEVYGVTYKEYLQQHKMDWAARQLLERKFKVGEIAEQLGYESHSRFSRAFQKRTQVLPSELINALKKSA